MRYIGRYGRRCQLSPANLGSARVSAGAAASSGLKLSESTAILLRPEYQRVHSSSCLPGETSRCPHQSIVACAIASGERPENSPDSPAWNLRSISYAISLRIAWSTRLWRGCAAGAGPDCVRDAEGWGSTPGAVF